MNFLRLHGSGSQRRLSASRSGDGDGDPDHHDVEDDTSEDGSTSGRDTLLSFMSSKSRSARGTAKEAKKAAKAAKKEQLRLSKSRRKREKMEKNDSNGTPPNALGDQFTEKNAFLELLAENGLFAPDVNAFMGIAEKRHPAKVYKEGTLQKQGSFFRTWHGRYFVVTSRGLSYYENKKRYRTGYLPFGFIAFRDVIPEAGKVVFDVPQHLVKALRIKGDKTNLFCMHKETRTYVMSAGSAEDKQEWQVAIARAYKRNRNNTLKLKTAPSIQRLPSLALTDDVFGDVTSVDHLDTIFEEELVKLRDSLQAKKVMLQWKAFADFMRTNPDMRNAAAAPSSH